MPITRRSHRVFITRLAGCVVASALAAGCGASRTAGPGTLVTRPAEPPPEPRNANGQQLEDLLFPVVSGMDRFDMDAALDEGGGYDGEYDDDTAVGEYYDETAAGQEAEDARAAFDYAVSELRELHLQLTQLEQGLAAESHPLAEDIGRIRTELTDMVEHPEEYPTVTSVPDVRLLIAPDLFNAMVSHVESEGPRRLDATDCSVATLALYGALYDTVVEVSADAHVSLNSYVAEQDQWLVEQQEQVAAVGAITEWLDRHETLPAEPWDQVEQLMSIAERLYDIETYLTPGTELSVTAAFDRLSEAEDAAEVRGALTALRAAVTGTLATVQSPPYQDEIRAYEQVPETLRRAMERLPNPGPRAALQVLGARGLAAQFDVIEYSPIQLNEAAQWARVACEGASPD